MVENLRENLEEKQDMVLSLTSIMDKITKENQNLRGKLEELQVICLHYRDTPPKNENSFLIYSPSGCCKPE